MKLTVIGGLTIQYNIEYELLVYLVTTLDDIRRYGFDRGALKEVLTLGRWFGKGCKLYLLIHRFVSFFNDFSFSICLYLLVCHFVCKQI